MKSLLAHNWFPPLVVMVCVGLMFFGAPAGGAFEWSDAPRHALNGVFVKDALAALPFNDPAGYAYRYYAQYPALTILFYPPLFYFLSAPFYAVFGVSHGTALLVVAVHYLFFAWGSWQLFRFWLGPWEACAAALMLVASPEIASWGRQVMLEIPAFAFLTWSAVMFTRYRREHRIGWLYLAAALLVLAMYTKISTCFMAAAFAGTLLAERRAALVRDRHTWFIILLAGTALVPLLLITVKFGQANMQSVTGIADATVSRSSISGWVWYLRQLPGQLGWPLALLAAVGAALALVRQRLQPMARTDALFWVLWFICGYIFFSAIDLKEARHSLFILPPLVLAAAILLTRLPAARGAIALAVLASAVLMQTLFMRPVLYVKGYAESANFIAQHAPQASSVLFSGYRDGSFIFNMRSHEERRDLTVVRADKLLLKVAVRRELGVKENGLTEAEIGERINQLGIHYVVAQPGFWDDLEAMQRFERVLASPQFKEVARIPTPANFNAHEKELVIYRNLGKVHEGTVRQDIDLPIIGTTIPAK
jgi:hypothetical protein